MKITKIHSYRLSYPLQRPFANSCVWNKARTAVVVEGETDAGIIGWGEGTAAPDSAVIAHQVIGRDPFEVEASCSSCAVGLRTSMYGTVWAPHWSPISNESHWVKLRASLALEEILTWPR